MSRELGLSVSAVREQLEVARGLGLVEVRPRTGMRRLPYSFSPAVKRSLSYALNLNRGSFEAFSDLRNHIESSFWFEAVRRLRQEDHQELHNLMARAWEHLNGTPIQIPHTEHRRLHLTIFSRLENLFVQGILEAYWDAYEAIGLSLYADYGYLQQVWTYHQQMVDAICMEDFEANGRCHLHGRFRGTLDEKAFEGAGAFLFGAVLECFFAKYVSINSFTETLVRTSNRGEVIRWPMRMGLRQTL